MHIKVNQLGQSLNQLVHK